MSTETPKAVPFLSDKPNLSERIGDAAYHLEQTKEPPTLHMLDSWDAQATNMEAELQRLRGLLDEARVALDALVSEASRHQLCDILSHPLKADRHKYGETCPPLARIEAVIAKWKR